MPKATLMTSEPSNPDSIDSAIFTRSSLDFDVMLGDKAMQTVEENVAGVIDAKVDNPPPNGQPAQHYACLAVDQRHVMRVELVRVIGPLKEQQMIKLRVRPI